MNFSKNKNLVFTLDAGGTNFVFSAIKGGKEVSETIIKPSNAHNLDKCLDTIVTGFVELKKELGEDPVAISFAFPGPADYPNGIIGDLTNLPAFRGGVALGTYLENKFHVPVFINNDGDLYAYGEALAGMLPEINRDLKNAGNQKRYKTLIGLTIGTGFGGGIVHNEALFIGDNSIAAEVWLMSNRVNPEFNAEEIVSTRSLIVEYNKESGCNSNELMPFDIYQIAMGQKEGDKSSALKAFDLFGRGIGDVIANLVTLLDGIVVIGGGISGAEELYMPSVIAELNHLFIGRNGETPRPVQRVYNYSDSEQKREFLKSCSKTIVVPDSSQTLSYDPVPRVAIAHSKMGASKAIHLGAYAFALSKLDAMN